MVTRILMGCLLLCYLGFAGYSWTSGHIGPEQIELVAFGSAIAIVLLSLGLYTIFPLILPYQKRWMLALCFSIVGLTSNTFIDDVSVSFFFRDGTIFFYTVLSLLIGSGYAVSHQTILAKEESELEIIEV